MTKADSPQPTDAELAILQVLWNRGASTVRDVHEVLIENRQTGYTTTLKLMQIMMEKGLVKRDETVRPQVYRAFKSRHQTQRQLLGDLVDRAFESPGSLVLQALSSKKTTPKEREQIRKLLDELEGGSR